MHIKSWMSQHFAVGIGLHIFTIWILLLPSISMGVVTNQGAPQGQSYMPGLDQSNAATLPNQKNAPGQLKMPGQKNGKSQKQRAQYIPGEVLVKFKGEVDDSKKKSVHDKMGAEVLSEIRKIGVHKVKSKHGLSTEELIRQYKNDPDVLFAEPNGIFRVQYNQMLPNDPYLDSLWGMSNANDYDIDAPEAWSLQTGGGVIVAVIDSGVDYTHPDLAANMVAGWDFTSCAQFYSDGSCAILKDRDSDPMDDYGHGTHVAGTIAAVGNNSTGVVGVSMNAKIMPIKVMNSNGEGSWEDAAAGIIYASEHGAKISNNSYGGCCATSLTLDAAIATAKQNGTLLFVTAAGNEDSDNDQFPFYPCSSLEPNVICVAATDQNDHLAYFSNYGATRVDLAAPGVDILSTVPSGSCLLCTSTGYSFLQGTSMAAPHVAGVAALAMAQFSTYTGDQIKNLLIESADRVASLTGKVASGGRLNANSALQPGIVINASPPSPASAPAGQSLTSTIMVQSLNNFSGTVSLNFSSADPNFTGSLSANSVRLNNDSKTVTLTAFSTSGMAAGVYPLMVTGTFRNSVHETETRSGNIAVTIQTDMAVTALSSTSSGQAGGWFTVSDTVQNQGTGLAKGFYVGYYLSTDNVITDADARIGSRWIPSLATGTSSASNSDVWVPSDLAVGNYYIGAIVDDLDHVPEVNVNNNSMSSNLVTISGAVPVFATWTNRYNGPDNNRDIAYKINIDAFGNTIVTGTACIASVSWDCVNFDVTTIKYSPDGTTLWTVSYDSGVRDWAVDQAVDGSGNVYVAITSCVTSECASYTAAVIKYDANNGNALWPSPARYDMGSPNALTVDNIGNAYLTGGWAQGGICGVTGVCEIATVKFDANGNQLWEDRVEAPAGNGGRDIAVDVTGNVYVTGSERGDYVTIKYGPNGGAPLWKVSYVASSYNTYQEIVLDYAGNVYVSGSDMAVYAWTGGDFDVVTVKYDNNGNQLWAKRYDNGSTDTFSSMAVDASGNVYVAATSSNGKGEAYEDYATIKYDTNGNFKWAARFSDSSQEIVNDLAIDRSGNVYVTGYACITSIANCWGVQDYATIKYGPDGHPRWYARYNNGSSDSGFALAVDGYGNVYVTGESINIFDSDYATVKYSTILPDNVAPTVPPGLFASAYATQISLGWIASTDNVGVTYYIIYRNGVEVASSYGTSYNDIGLKSGITYSYTVTACDEAGNCSAQSAAVTATTLEGVPPSVPTRLSASSFSTTQINLTWSASTDNVGVTGYKVYRNGVQVGAPSGTSYSDTGLKAATSYKYSVAACDAAGNCSAQSPAVTASTKKK